MLTRAQAKQLSAKILAMSKADEARVRIGGGWTTHVRFARNSPSTSGNFSNPAITVRSTFGQRSASASINQFDDDSLRSVVARSEELAKAAPADREHMPALGSQAYTPVAAAYVDTSPEATADKMTDHVARCIDDARKRDLLAAGFAQARAGYECLASSKGLFAYHKATTTTLSETARTKDGTGSGWASRAANAVARIDAAGLSKAATDKALASAKPRALKPGTYTTILEPACTASLIGIMRWSMNARSAHEGRSFFSAPNGGTRVGQQLFPKAVNIYSDPHSPVAPSRPWDGSGLPLRHRDWIKDGAVANLTYSRYWAKKKGVAPVPGGSNLIMNGGSQSIDDLIKSTKRGVLVTSLWYIRGLDPRTLLFTGLTRDGVFWIEDGKIAYPVNNFRWNDSPISVLKNVEAMSAAVRVPPRGSTNVNVVAPALKVKKFTFSSVSDAV